MRAWIAAIAALLMTGQAPAQETPPPTAWRPTAGGVVHWRGVDVRVELYLDTPAPVLAARLPDGTVAPLRIVTHVKDALAILADERLAFAWGPLLDRTGADLSPLRDRVIERARVTAATGLVVAPPQGRGERFAGSAAVLTTLQLASALWDGGRRDEAIRMLRDRLAALPDRADPAEGGYSEVAYGDRLAGYLFEAGDLEGALALFDRLRTDARITPAFRLNADVNKALVLARAGRGAEALALVDRAWAAFGAQDRDPAARDAKLPDSESQFAWVKACALAKAGRRAEATAMLARITPDDDPTAEGGTRSTARVSGLVCIGDVPGLAREWTRQLVDPVPAAALFVSMQPDDAGSAGERATVAAALRDPAVVAAMRGKVRLLPPEFRAAVSNWRDAGAH